MKRPIDRILVLSAALFFIVAAYVAYRIYKDRHPEAYNYQTTDMPGGGTIPQPLR
jgi:hypothetical protein